MLNLAHRGFRAKYPENTLLAFRKAMQAGADGVELDVQLSKDNIPVIIHDEFIDRTTLGKGLVMQYTFEELKNFAKNEDSVIPSLEEYFEQFKGQHVITNIELKNSAVPYAGIEKLVLDIVERYGVSDDVFVSSFNHASVAYFKKLAPHIKVGVLTNNYMYKPFDYLRQIGADFYHPVSTMMTEEAIREYEAEGFEVNLWFDNYFQGLEKYVAMKPRSIITDFPDEIIRLCKGENK